MQHKPVLSIDLVKLVAMKCEEEATRIGRNVTFAIVDDGGHLMYLQRPEKAASTGAEIAPAKARLAAMGRRHSVEYQSMIDNGRLAFVSALCLPAIRGAGLEGGVAIFFEGWCIGAVGVAGASSQEDAQIAAYAITAAGLSTVN